MTARHTVVYIPSQTLDPEELIKMEGFVFFEERPLLSSILLLRNPESQLVFVTSIPIPQQAVDYYVSLTCTDSISAESINNRLLLLTVDDASALDLCSKLQKRDQLIEQIRNWIEPDNSHMVCILSTPKETELAARLGIRLVANPPELFYLGTKHGSRKLFHESGVPHPDGCAQSYNIEQTVGEISKIWERNPKQKELVVKLNEGVSGEGNAILRLDEIGDFCTDNSNIQRERIHQQLEHMRFIASNECWSSFCTKIQNTGCIVEVWLESVKSSPSVQGYIDENGKVSIISTHEQILEKSNVFYGCSFPANSAYRNVIQRYSLAVGESLAKYGARERFAIDFVVTPHAGDGEQLDVFAIEINLRSSGTTHPYETVRRLIDGHYNFDDGLLYCKNGNAKYYWATDKLHFTSLIGTEVTSLVNLFNSSGLGWNSQTFTGCVFYCLAPLQLHGRVGLIAVANSDQEAKELYEAALALLTQNKQ